MRTRTILLLICLAALALRVIALLAYVDFPGIADPLHYFNMGARLAAGYGFTIDYIWQYTLPPDSIIHPEEHWMPLTAVLAAIPMLAFGESARAALIPFVLLGSLLPLISFAAARQLKVSDEGALFAAACCAFLPELLLYATRTDTVIPYALLIGVCILLITRGLDYGRALDFALAGVAAGLAYLTRSDALLLIPMLIVTVIARYLLRDRPRWRYAPLALVVLLLVASPWIARSYALFDTFGSPESRSMFFFTDHNDHYAFGRAFTLETLLAAQTPMEIIGKRAFELLAALKVMIETLDIFLPVAVIGGALLLIGDRDRARTAAPVLILLLGMLIAYPLLIPYKAQAGSFKKVFVSLIPLLLPLGALALERAIHAARLRRATMLIVIVLLAARGFDAVRLEQSVNQAYLAQIEVMAFAVRDLPDTNDDAELILMTQDPYILRYVGIQSIMFPHEPLDDVITIAQRYGVDYLLMPSTRPALDALLTDEAVDPRFVLVTALAGTPLIVYRIDSAATHDD